MRTMPLKARDYECSQCSLPFTTSECLQVDGKPACITCFSRPGNHRFYGSPNCKWCGAVTPDGHKAA